VNIGKVDYHLDSPSSLKAISDQRCCRRDHVGIAAGVSAGSL
jgi:hypothetical protein